jgi:hypothetical protein
MQNIQFPENPDENNRGTAVVWVKDENSQLPIIIASLRKQDDFYMLEPNQLRLSRSKGNKTAEVFLDANNSELTVNVLGDAEEPANMKIKVVSENANSTFSLYSDNAVRVDAKQVDVVATDELNLKIEDKGKTKGHIHYKLSEGIQVITEEKAELIVRDDNDEEQATITYEHETGLTYKDEFDNEITCKDKEIHVKSEKVVAEGDIQHNDGGEKMVKGDTLKDLLDKLCSQVSDICTAALAITVTCGMPGSPSGVPLNAAQFTAAQTQVNAIKGQLDTILSQKSTLD